MLSGTRVSLAECGSIVTRAGSIVTRAGTIVTRAESIVMRAGTIVMRAESIVIRAGTIVTRAGTIVIRAGTIVMRACKITVDESAHVFYTPPYHRLLCAPSWILYQRSRSERKEPRCLHPTSPTVTTAPRPI